MNGLLWLLLVGVAGPVGFARWLERRAAPRILARLADGPRNARIVVLGCPARTASGAPNRYLLGRVAAAAAAYHRCPERRLLCSGGPARADAEQPPDRDEAEALAALLVEANVPRASIDLDARSARTIDSIDHLVARYAHEPILLVTQAFHLPRALHLARARGLEAWGLPADGPAPGLAVRLRERLAQLRALLDLMRPPNGS